MRAKEITGQTIYVGPRVNSVGLGRNTIFRNGVHPAFHGVIETCPAIGELIVPIARNAEVRRELKFDLAGNMRGTNGRYVTLFREVQKWLAKQAEQRAATSTGVTIKHHA